MREQANDATSKGGNRNDESSVLCASPDLSQHDSYEGLQVLLQECHRSYDRPQLRYDGAMRIHSIWFQWRLFW
jgi:hypothetical protein